jgi:hypothetical protein
MLFARCNGKKVSWGLDALGHVRISLSTPYYAK